MEIAVNGSQASDRIVETRIEKEDNNKEIETVSSFVPEQDFVHGAKSTRVKQNAQLVEQHHKEQLEQRRADKKLEQTTAQLEQVSDKAEKEDCQALEEEGSPYEEYQAEILDRAFERIKENRQEKEDSIESQVEQKKTAREQVQEMGIAIMMASAAASLSDPSMQYLIEQKLSSTIQNIYKAVYATTSQSAATSKAHMASGDVQQEKGTKDEAVWEQVKEDAKRILEEDGIPFTSEVEEKARWLFERSLPVSEENVTELESLVQLKEEANSPDYQEAVKKKIQETIQVGRAAGETELGTKWERLAKHAIERFSQLEESKFSSLTAHRQLEEIRLKLTTESGIKLLKKGIALDTSHLQEIVDGLKELEHSYYKAMLEEAGANPTEEKAELANKVEQSRLAVMKSPVYSLGIIYHSQEQVTLKQVEEEGNQLATRLQQAGEAYETMATEVRRDLGDSIKKAFASADSLLKELNLEPTEENRRAVRILGYNQIEITKDSINQMKYYDAKVNRTLRELKPAVVVRMIKEEKNPLTMSMEELAQTAHEISQKIEPEDEKYSRFLWKLDKQGALTKEERQAYIGVYRLLHQIEQSDGAAVGAVVETGGELTLKNLLTAVRTRKSGGIDKVVEESAGTAEVKRKEASITEQIEMAFGREIAANKREELAEREDSYIQWKTQQIKEITGGSKEAVQFLQEFSIPETPVYLQAAKELLSGNKKLMKLFAEKENRKEFQEMGEASLQVLEEKEELQKACTELEAFLERRLSEEKKSDDISFEDFVDFRELGYALRLAGDLRRQEHYEIPLVEEDGAITRLSLTIKGNQRGEGNLFIHMNFPEGESLSGNFFVKENQITGYLQGDYREQIEKLSDKKEDLVRRLNEEGGFQAIDITYHLAKPRLEKVSGNREKGEDTKKLYQTAKILVSHMRQVKGEEKDNEN